MRHDEKITARLAELDSGLAMMTDLYRPIHGYRRHNTRDETETSCVIFKVTLLKMIKFRYITMNEFLRVTSWG